MIPITALLASIFLFGVDSPPIVASAQDVWNGNTCLTFHFFSIANCNGSQLLTLQPLLAIVAAKTNTIEIKKPSVAPSITIRDLRGPDFPSGATGGSITRNTYSSEALASITVLVCCSIKLRRPALKPPGLSLLYCSFKKVIESLALARLFPLRPR